MLLQNKLGGGSKRISLWGAICYVLPISLWRAICYVLLMRLLILHCYGSKTDASTNTRLTGNNWRKTQIRDIDDYNQHVLVQDNNYHHHSEVQSDYTSKSNSNAAERRNWIEKRYFELTHDTTVDDSKRYYKSLSHENDELVYTSLTDQLLAQYRTKKDLKKGNKMNDENWEDFNKEEEEDDGILPLFKEEEHERDYRICCEQGLIDPEVLELETENMDEEIKNESKRSQINTNYITPKTDYVDKDYTPIKFYQNELNQEIVKNPSNIVGNKKGSDGNIENHQKYLNKRKRNQTVHEKQMEESRDKADTEYLKKILAKMENGKNIEGKYDFEFSDRFIKKYKTGELSQEQRDIMEKICPFPYWSKYN